MINQHQLPLTRTPTDPRGLTNTTPLTPTTMTHMPLISNPINMLPNQANPTMMTTLPPTVNMAARLQRQATLTVANTLTNLTMTTTLTTTKASLQLMPVNPITPTHKNQAAMMTMTTMEPRRTQALTTKTRITEAQNPTILKTSMTVNIRLLHPTNHTTATSHLNMVTTTKL